MANTVPNRKIITRQKILLGALLLVIAIAAVTAVLVLTGGGGKDGPWLPTIGNGGGNLANGGTLLAVDGKVYLTAGDGSLIQTEPGKTEGSALGELKGCYLNSDGNTLWYVDANTGALMRSDLSGANPTAIVEGKITRLTRCEDYLYFVDADSDYALSRVSIADPSAVEPLSAARVMQFTCVGDRIYYIDLNNSDALCFIPLTGGEATQANERVGQVLFGQGNRLFISNPEREGALDCHVLLSDGVYGAVQALDTGTVTCAVADDKAVYYTKAVDGKLYALDLTPAKDGTRTERQLTDFPVYGLQDAGDYIYYQTVADGGQWGAVAK